eukprot:CAMPEP_0185614686 /NCGR_PEP_ID=MMETSP0436-20130131/32837_1 /TAXON_ID=626734 ORGANISM="Favella taraikaensis, Strain Fe Narragansett Bay" /NCGR_SAMPLE_ID=MMETSP0436 /ASSEMBLY_ACC=CAM_ASM_000390 /LENGTH=40 /DNA_ID= /DNA_START= /DNA_END= /DNA_ORIENTATION=
MPALENVPLPLTYPPPPALLLCYAGKLLENMLMHCESEYR